MECKLILQSPLVKIFPEEGPVKPEYLKFSALQGETASFQAVYRGNNPYREELSVCVDSPLNAYIRVRGVELCPSAYPCHPETDDGYLRTALSLKLKVSCNGAIIFTIPCIQRNTLTRLP